MHTHNRRLGSSITTLAYRTVQTRLLYYGLCLMLGRYHHDTV